MTATGLGLLAADSGEREQPVNIGVKPTVLLVLLAAAGPHGIPRRGVRDLLWEGSPDANASNSLRQSIFRIRRAIGADALADVGGRLYLRRPIIVDLFEIERALAEHRLTEAIESVAGPIGAALDVAGPALRGWVRDLRMRLERRLLDALTRAWAEASRGPAPELFLPTLVRAHQILGDLPELLWIQLDCAATAGDPGTFEQVAARLGGTVPRVGSEAGDRASRIQSLRSRLHDRPRESPGALSAPIHLSALRELEEAWRHAAAGHGSVLCLAGAPGTGRTWLLRELARRTLAGAGRSVPLIALRSADGMPSVCLRDLTVALRGYRGAAGIHPEFSDTIDRLHEGVLTPPGDAIPAVHDLLNAVAVEGPLLVTLDDAQHYDARILTRLLRHLQETPVPGLLVVAVLPPAAVPAGIPTLTIGAADPEGIRTLLAAMARLPRAEWVPGFVDSLHHATSGNPGRAARAVVQLHSAGHLRVVDDRWSLTTSLPEALNALGSTAA